MLFQLSKANCDNDYTEYHYLPLYVATTQLDNIEFNAMKTIINFSKPIKYNPVIIFQNIYIPVYIYIICDKMLKFCVI